MHIDHGYCILKNGFVLLDLMDHTSVHCGKYVFPKAVDPKLLTLPSEYLPRLASGYSRRAPVCMVQLICVPDDMDFDIIKSKRVAGHKWFNLDSDRSRILPSTRIHVDSVLLKHV